MNKVKQRCETDNCAKFYFTSIQMFREIKFIKAFMYLLNVIPVIICFISTDNQVVKAICSLVSFSLNIFTEVISSLISNYKESAILEKQIYESEITGSTFSKIEYDREETNDMQELAIRKGIPKIKKEGKYPVQYVPEEISDDYSYLYLTRKSAAGDRFILSRLFYLYFILLILIASIFVIIITFSPNKNDGTKNFTTNTVLLLICFWPLIIPLIRICVSCRKSMRNCVKICADIDNFFADGDNSYERLARFYYYVQNIEFEMLMAKPVIFGLINKVFDKHLRTLNDGVTQRFIEAVNELKSKTYIQKGVISSPKGQELITKRDYSLEQLKQMEHKTKTKKKEPSPVSQSTEKKKTPVKKQEKKKAKK